MHISLRCTWAHNQDTNSHVHKHAMNFSQEVVFPENVSFEEYLVTMEICTIARSRGSMGNGGSLSVPVCLFGGDVDEHRMCHIETVWYIFELLSDI